MGPTRARPRYPVRTAARHRSGKDFARHVPGDRMLNDIGGEGGGRNHDSFVFAFLDEDLLLWQVILCGARLKKSILSFVSSSLL